MHARNLRGQRLRGAEPPVLMKSTSKFQEDKAQSVPVHKRAALGNAEGEISGLSKAERLPAASSLLHHASETAFI